MYSTWYGNGTTEKFTAAAGTQNFQPFSMVGTRSCLIFVLVASHLCCMVPKDGVVMFVHVKTVTSTVGPSMIWFQTSLLAKCAKLVLMGNCLSRKAYQ